MRLKAGGSSGGIVFGNGLALFVMLDGVGLAEEVQNDLSVDEGAASMVELGLRGLLSTPTPVSGVFLGETNLEPLALDVEHGLDHVGDVNVDDVGRDAHNGAMLLVEPLQLELGLPSPDMIEIPESRPS